MAVYRVDDWSITKEEMVVELAKWQMQRGELRTYGDIHEFLKSQEWMSKGRITGKKIAQIRTLLGDMRGEDWR